MADENKLSKEEQIFIVEQLACFRTSKQIIDSVKEIFEKVINKQQIYYYSQLCAKKLTTKPNKTTLELQTIFDNRRTEFKKKVEDIAGFNITWRMEILTEIVEKEREKQELLQRTPIILDAIEIMAKEAGGMFTNRRELTGANGKPLIPVEQMAVALFKSLINKGLTEDEAANFTAKRYQVDKEKIINSD